MAFRFSVGRHDGSSVHPYHLTRNTAKSRKRSPSESHSRLYAPYAGAKWSCTWLRDRITVQCSMLARLQAVRWNDRLGLTATFGSSGL